MLLINYPTTGKTLPIVESMQPTTVVKISILSARNMRHSEFKNNCVLVQTFGLPQDTLSERTMSVKSVDVCTWDQVSISLHSQNSWRLFPFADFFCLFVVGWLFGDNFGLQEFTFELCNRQMTVLLLTLVHELNMYVGITFQVILYAFPVYNASLKLPNFSLIIMYVYFYRFASQEGRLHWSNWFAVE
jgi:hypothetical protein